MRIISGKLKGRVLTPPKDFKARPTTDFAKSGLFNLLQTNPGFNGLKVLDLFSGSGSIGLEFYSRGASEVLMIETDSDHARFIQSSIEKYAAEKVRVMRADVFRYLEETRETFDLIFADPPYDMENRELLPEIIFNRELLKADGIFILEHSADLNFETHLHFNRSRNYGSVHFTFFK